MAHFQGAFSPDPMQCMAAPAIPDMVDLLTDDIGYVLCTFGAGDAFR